MSRNLRDSSRRTGVWNCNYNPYEAIAPLTSE